MQALPVKCVVVGDRCVGKTCLLLSYTEDEFPGEYIRAITEPCQKYVRVDGQICFLSLWDTATGHEEYDRLRPLAYSQTDIFIVCFSLVARDSYENIQRTWYPEIKHHCPGTPIILVGTKLDLRGGTKEMENGVKTELTYDEGTCLAQQINAVKYLECSAKMNDGTKQIFDEAIKACLVLQKRKKKETKRKCKIM